MGDKSALSDREKTLNWQSKNFMYQNKMLSTISQFINIVSHTQTKLVNRVEALRKKEKQSSTQHDRLIQ